MTQIQHGRATMVEPQAIVGSNNVETLATEIIDRVTLGAMNIVDASGDSVTESGTRVLPGNSTAESDRGKCCCEWKNRNRSLRLTRRSDERLKKKARREEPENCHWNPEESLPGDVDRKASEEIRKIVEGLRGVRIGDSALVKPVTRVPSLEREVKRAIADMGHEARCGISEINSPITEGQGDVETENYREPIRAWIADEIASSAVIFYPEQRESEPEKRNAENDVRLSRQPAHRVQPDMSKLRSTCFLHRIIKELEDAEASRENVLDGTSASISAISQERIAAWEESEERFIRTIEQGSKDGSEIEEGPNDIGPMHLHSNAIEEFKDVPIGRVVDVEIIELESTSGPFETEVSPNIATTSDYMLACEASSGTLERSTSGKKKSVRDKLRKFFTSAFKRGKH